MSDATAPKRTRPPARYPVQVNIQYDERMGSKVDKGCQIGGVSRAAFIRACIEEASDTVTLRLRSARRGKRAP